MAAGQRLFLDASVLVAAAGSQRGGSASLLAVCQARDIPLLVSRLVLREAERNIRRKLGEASLVRFYQLIGRLDLQLVPSPTSRQIDAAAEVVAAKDAHVLAAARTGQATHLITLDRRHFLSDRQKRGMLPINACTPGEFLGEL
jgi:predicted nucleic acid-binding protein